MPRLAARRSRGQIAPATPAPRSGQPALRLQLPSPCISCDTVAVRLWLSGDPQADELLSSDPLALVIGLILDQQVPLERAFAAPAELARRLGGELDPASIAAMDPQDLAAVFVQKPALHRYPASMAGRVQDLCRIVTESYGGDAATIWSTAASSEELLRRLRSLPGFGDQKARIFLAFLAKQMRVRHRGWQEASHPFGEPGTRMSIADIVDARSLAEVRDYKQKLKQQAGRQPGKH